MNIWYFIITALNPLGLFQLHEVGDTTITILKGGQPKNTPAFKHFFVAKI